jgi:8-oxo-dGTP pyrophosphatase MutT (NUDIX family)
VVDPAPPLERVLRALDSEGRGHFCHECGAPILRTIDDQRGERFRCAADHLLERSFLFDGRAVFSVENGRLVHESVGAIVRRRSKILLFHRRRYPIGWTIPAGHIERDTEPEEEMKREVLEEVGLEVVRSRRLWEGTPLLGDCCRRGADLHRWHLFEIEAEGEVELNEEGDDYRWFEAGELRELSLIPPVATIFRRLRIPPTDS